MTDGFADSDPLGRDLSDRDLYVGQLQAIHRLRDELELDDEDYRDLLYRLTGSRSAKWMTAEQRAKVIAFMTLHQALDAAVAHAEEAREILNAAYAQTPTEHVWDKELYLDGRFVERVRTPLETAAGMMRNLHGNGVRLVGASEEREEGRTWLRLEFATAETDPGLPF